MLTRRFVVAAAAASAATAAVPAGAAAPPPAPAPPLPAWIVGTDGDFNFQIVRAATRHDAILTLAQDETGLRACSCSETLHERRCAFCHFASRDAYRAEHFDAIATPSAADWIRAGFGHCCSRCDIETFAEEGGHAVGEEAVCEDCMTLADWDLVDPERAAEIREEMADG
jgi:hypothetical protein